MTLTRPAPPERRQRTVWARPSQPARRFGYAVAIGVNAALLYVANNLLEWDVVPFLTADFDRVLPIVNVSLVASIVVNAMFLSYDADWFKSLCQAVLAAISLAVIARTFAVFPFDFSAYEFDWEALTRGIMIFMMVALSIAVVAETVKAFTSLTRSSES
jgi:hypothetical protein